MMPSKSGGALYILTFDIMLLLAQQLKYMTSQTEFLTQEEQRVGSSRRAIV
jgi:hypothetical protein